jgi:hypothetical protein
MRRSENEYSRYFNRKHRRDGTLIRGRFMSRPVQTQAYRRAVVRYIDANPVGAKLATKSWLYPLGSARSYVLDERPPWLERSWIEAEVAASSDSGVFSAKNYASVFGACGAGICRLVEHRLDCPRRGPDELDDLIRAAPEQVREWLIRKARLADGHVPGQPVCDASTVLATLRAEAKQLDWSVSAFGRKQEGEGVALVGLLRSLATLTWSQISLTCGLSARSCQHRFHRHLMLMHHDSEYSKRVARLTATALEACLTPGERTELREPELQSAQDALQAWRTRHEQPLPRPTPSARRKRLHA